LFDTGNTGNGIIGNSFLTKNNLYDEFSNIISLGSKKIAYLPKIIIGEQIIEDGVITLEKQNKNGSNYKFGGLFGNKILKRFNVIIDNREGLIYMKPNFFFEQKGLGLYQIYLILFSSILGIGLIIFFIRIIKLLKK